MAPLRTPSLSLVLLLALILPLQSFAAARSCSAQTGAAAAHSHSHCAGDPGKPQSAEPHHHCGTCCAAAVALTPFRWTAPGATGSEAFLPVHRPHPKVTLDRLDRPPRSFAS